MSEDMFTPTNPEVKLIVDLARECETADPIDWSELKMTEEQAYVLMATHVLEMERNELTDAAIIVKLMVENFVLNLKLLGKQ